MRICRYRWLEREGLAGERGLVPCGDCDACGAFAPADAPPPAGPRPARPARTATRAELEAYAATVGIDEPDRFATKHELNLALDAGEVVPEEMRG